MDGLCLGTSFKKQTPEAFAFSQKLRAFFILHPMVTPERYRYPVYSANTIGEPSVYLMFVPLY